MKTYVKLGVSKHNEWEPETIGYIDGYCRGGNGVPFACVVVGDKIVMCELHNLTVIKSDGIHR